MSSERDWSEHSEKMKIEVYAKKISVRVFVREVRGENGQISNIFLFTKLIFQSLTVERILLLSHSLNSLPKNEVKEKGFEIDHDEQIAFNEDLVFLHL
jgi:hypothetical protein